MTKSFDYKRDTVVTSKNLEKYNIDKIESEDILKSKDAIVVLNGFRWVYYNNVYQLAMQDKIEEEKILIQQMIQKFDKNKLPFTSKDAEKYFADLFSQGDKNYR